MSEGILVTFLDQTGAKSVKAKISGTVAVQKIIPSIITKMMLPVTAPDGLPMSYSLDAKRLGVRLVEEKTLPEQGIREGDVLIVYPEIVAGGTAISELWAYVMDDDTGNEGIMGTNVEHIGWLSFSAHSRENLDVYREYVQEGVRQCGRPAKVVRFTQREEVELVQ
jgi:hypothetical protein